MEILLIVAAALIAGVVGFLAGKSVTDSRTQARLVAARATAEDEADRIRAAARQEAETLRKAEVLKGREEAIRSREEWEREEAKRRDEVDRLERRLQERTETLDRKLHLLDEKGEAQERRAQELAQREKQVEQQSVELAGRMGEVQHRLEALAGLSADEARRQLMHDMEEQAKAAAAQRIREIEEE